MLGGSPGGLAPPKPHLAIMMGRSVPAEPSFSNMTQPCLLFLKNSSGSLSGQALRIERWNAINHNQPHAACQLMRIGKRGLIGNGMRVEYKQVGECAGSNKAAILETEMLGGL